MTFNSFIEELVLLDCGTADWTKVFFFWVTQPMKKVYVSDFEWLMSIQLNIKCLYSECWKLGNRMENIGKKNNFVCEGLSPWIYFLCLLYRDYYIHLLSFRMKIADMKTSEGIWTRKSFLMYRRYANTGMQTKYLSKRNRMPVQLVIYSLRICIRPFVWTSCRTI